MAEELRMLNRLNLETRVHHGEADADVDEYLFRPQVTPADYRMFLQRVYGFVAPLEAALLSAPGLYEVIDVRARAKAPLIAADLLALGMTLDEIQRLPQCMSMPAFRGPASALGWMYVVERPLLSAAVIRGHLATYLPTEMACASSYFLCYQGLVGTMWRELGVAMDTVAYSPAIEDRIIAGASEAFRLIARWRKQDSSSQASAGIIRIAG
jgi:heme oxygenase (biliverdin-IX-beta and delta-forming)